jgi:hypothetical protein
MGCIYFLFMEKKMKKKLLMSLVLFIVIGTSAVFAQNTAKYYLEIWNVSQATYNAIDSRFKTSTQGGYEDSYFLARSSNGSTLRYKDGRLTFEQVRQKLLEIDPRGTNWVNHINNYAIPEAQQYWGANGIGNNTSPSYCVYYWIRRQE